MTARAVDFWFDFASTYSYPAAMTIESRAAECGVTVRWRPFLLGPIFAEQSWADSPFNLQPAKGRYMWRDLERLCQAAGLPFRRPETFPQHSVAAARIMLHGLQAGWGPAFAKAIFAAEFAHRANIRDEAILADAVRRAGGDPARTLAAARDDAVKAQLRAEVETARRLGVFGAPTFLAGEEMFWGYDRMVTALDWAAAHA